MVNRLELESHTWYETIGFFFKFNIATLHDDRVDIIAIEKNSSTLFNGRISLSDLSNTKGTKIVQNQKALDILYGNNKTRT